MPAYAGIHLSGPNTAKTALVVLQGDLVTGPVRIAKVYEKIGAFGTLFSDERVVELLRNEAPLQGVFVDCPLTLPPCVACQRPSCPGAIRCDDIAVAFMLAVSSKHRRRGARKARPINPQSQRLWDVMQMAAPGAARAEPSFSANQAPLVARARTLQRRLNAEEPFVQLQETSVAHAVAALADALELEGPAHLAYRSFESGLEARLEILDGMTGRGWIEEGRGATSLTGVATTVELFHAFIAAWVAVAHGAGWTVARPTDYVPAEGWVHLPDPEHLP